MKPRRVHLKCRLPLSAFPLDIDVSFESQVSAVFGPSGSGKTSLLDAIAGLRDISSGEIEIGERLLFSSTRKIDISPRDRSIGYVPQETALFPHMSVRKNLLYGSRRKGAVGESSGISLDHVAGVLEISHLLDRGVDRISGGESQRVALGRAILSRPELLLLDEPLASLDIGLKERILPYLRRVRDEFAIPMIYVTHNPTEVLSLADWVVVLREGRVVAQGHPREILFSSGILPHFEEDQVENVFNAWLIDSDPDGGRSRARLDYGPELFIPYIGAPANRPLQIGIRADDILLATRKPEGISAGNVLRGTVQKVNALGAGQSLLKVDAGAPFFVRLTSSSVDRLHLAEGSEIFLIIKTRSCLLL